MSELTRSYMEQKLRVANPNWNPLTMQGWSYNQLKQVYYKQARKCIARTIARLT